MALLKDGKIEVDGDGYCVADTLLYHGTLIFVETGSGQRFFNFRIHRHFTTVNKFGYVLVFIEYYITIFRYFSSAYRIREEESVLLA